MTLPEAVARIVKRMTQKRRMPFVLVAPDNRVFMAMDYQDLVRMTAPEFAPMLQLPPVKGAEDS